MHGVLNTDNMSLGGLTIDYGPFAFIDYFSKDYVSNATDEHERYSFRRQPQIIEWNLQQLAEAMDPLFPNYIGVQYLKDNYFTFYNQKYYQLMSAKLGLAESKESEQLIDQMMENMHVCGTHFTNFFRLIEQHSKQEISEEQLVGLVIGQSEPTEFYLKGIRAFSSLLSTDINEILEQDAVFNPYLITEQKERLKRRDTLRQESCKERTQN